MEAVTAIDIHTSDDLKDIELTKEIYAVLARYYPGHPWGVGASHASGMVDIQLFYLDKYGRISRHGMGLHIGKLEGAEFNKKIRNAGGEILERYHLSRAKATDESELIFQEKGIDKTGAIK